MNYRQLQDWIALTTLRAMRMSSQKLYGPLGLRAKVTALKRQGTRMPARDFAVLARKAGL